MEGGKALHSLKVNATRLGQRLGENLAEHSRDLGLVDSFASGSGGGAGKYLENGAVITGAGIEETKRMLASRSERERMEGLKRVMAMMTKSLPVTSFFPLVTSLLSPSTPIPARNLISLYIIHCASTAPELALLSINAYQKDLSDPNPIVRAGALTTLSSMGLDDIRSLVGVAVSKGARDGSWYVRRAAADAVTALYKADPSPSNAQQLQKTLEDLIRTASPLTLGSVLAAYEAVCPERWELVHPMFRKWCKMLVDVEEWGQVALVRLFTRYGRKFFNDPARTGKLDADADLLLKASEMLLQHMNPAVVTAVVRLHYYLGMPTALAHIIRPLLRLLQNSTPEIQLVVLENCTVIAEERPDLMVDHVSEFLVRNSDQPGGKRLRLRILVALANEKTVKILMNEFLTYVKDADESFSSASIAAIGTCAKRVPAVTGECLKTLIKLTQSMKDAVISPSVLVLRSLLRSSSPSVRVPIVRKLALLVHAGKINAPVARANIYWLVGQYASEGMLESVGPDLVRVGVKGFAEESDAAKLQLLTLSAKLLLLSHLSTLTPNLRALSLLFVYATSLARYDVNYEVRDRARFLKALLASAGIGKAIEGEETPEEGRTMTGDQIRKVLFEGKRDEVDDARSIPGELGTFSLSIPDRKLIFTSPLPPYSLSSIPPASIRDPPPSLLNDSPAPTTAPLRGFGSDTPRSAVSSNGRASPVVLVPTNFASASGDGVDSRGVSPSPLAGLGPGGRKEFIDLEDFLGGEDEEEEEEEESESEEEGDEASESEEEEEEEEEEEGGTGSDKGVESDPPRLA